MISLYDDQTDLVERVRGSMRRHKSILMQAATGAGKTRMSSKIVSLASAKGTRSVFLVPRRELLRQTAAEFTKHGIPFGMIAAGYPPSPFQKIQIATSGTYAKRMLDMPVPDLLIVDETHYGGAELDRIIQRQKVAGKWTLGLSATPTKLSGKGLDVWYDHMEEGLSLSELIELGRLSDYQAFAPSQPDLSSVKTVAGDFAKGQLNSVMENDKVLIGDAVRHYRDHALGKLNVAYCTSVRHAEIVAESFNAVGIPAASIDGKMKDDERSKLIKAFARRELLVLANCDLLTFGFDLASAAGMDVTVECMSDLRPTQSLALQMQKWGRVLRMKDLPAMIFDHAGNVQRHGMPDEDREWSLAGRKKRGKEDAEKTEPVRQCTECYFVHRPTPSCPNCGFVYPVQSRMVEEVEGDLELLERKPITKKQEQGMARTLEDLIKLGSDRGYSNPASWAHRILAARGGRR